MPHRRARGDAADAATRVRGVPSGASADVSAQRGEDRGVERGVVERGIVERWCGWGWRRRRRERA